ncbi:MULTISPECIES: DUF3987 domain-containing protein [Rhodanobacter]|uniref:DUF3987 domain-containing protein n=1 Tax=Rhodanobacter TaxID=75309 RepID=UPI000ADFA67B|nr:MULTISPECIES: DUF3987 domain-containing protein [Rhodanobacter]UJJ55223.1 DUF3987 domain-containing protein [Rhodanobacter thiooxydans]
MTGLNVHFWRKKLEHFAPTETEYPFMATPPLIRKAAECVSVQHQLSPELYIVVAQAAASLAVQGVAVLKMPDGRFVPLSLYFLILAETGLGKSPAFETFFRLFQERDRTAAGAFEKATKEYPARHRSWRRQCDDLTKMLSKARQKGEPLHHIQVELNSLVEQEPIEPRLQNWLISDTTAAAFLKRLAGVGESIALAGDEGEKLLAHLYQYIADLCQLWSHGRTDSHRIGTGTTLVVNSRVMALLLIQAENFYKFCEAAGKKAFGMGVWARFLTITPKEPRPGFTSTENLDATNEPLDAFLARIAELITERARRVKAGVTEQDIVEFNADARDCWDAFDREMRVRSSSHAANRKGNDADEGYKPGDLLDVRAFAAKASMHAARLAAVFAYFIGDTKITLDTMECAIRIIRYHIEAYRDQFSLAKVIPRVVEDCLKLETFFRRLNLNSGGSTVVSLDSLHHINTTSDLKLDKYLLPALLHLQQQGKIQIIPTNGGKQYVHFRSLINMIN